MRTAELVLFLFCPPGPLPRKTSTRQWRKNCRSSSSATAQRAFEGWDSVKLMLKRS
jgi:hypothetical protein